MRRGRNQCMLLYHTVHLASLLFFSGAKGYISGLLSGTNLDALNDLPIEQLVVTHFRYLHLPSLIICSQVTNTVPQTEHLAQFPKLTVIDIAPTIAESIRRTHNGESISLLFGEWAEDRNRAV